MTLGNTPPELTIALGMLLFAVITSGPPILILAIRKVGRMSWINWFVRPKEVKEKPVAPPVRLPMMNPPKPKHRVEIISVNNWEVRFRVDNGTKISRKVSRETPAEEVVAEYIEAMDAKEAELRRVQEEINKRF